MKKSLVTWSGALSLALLFALLFTLAASAAEIDPRVDSEFSKRGDQAKVSVIVKLKSQVVFRDIPKNVVRSAYVKRTLVSHARLSQKPVVEYIKSITKDAAESLWITNALVIATDRPTLMLIAQRSEVDSIRLNARIQIEKPVAGIRRAGNPASPNEWSIDIMNVPAVWSKYGLHGENVRIGHIDTGCEGSHPDVAGKIYAFRDFISGKNDVPYDDQGHGTHTVGTILGGNASGKSIGVAPAATIAVAKVFDRAGSAQTDGILKAMQWIMDPDENPATDDVPRLVSNSWGSSDLERTFWDPVSNWRAANIFPLFAAGNSGPSPKTVGTPGGFPHAFAIGATNRSDKAASFSSRGPVTWDGVVYIKPEASAPGEDIRSAVPGGGWGSKSGTSMATPNVAGVIALLYQAKPDLTIEEVSQILESTALDLGTPGKDNDFGSGRVDAYQAVTRVLNSGVFTLKVTGGNGSPLLAKITLDDKLKFDTKNDGTFKMSLEAGTYQLKVSCFGYITEARGLKIEKNQTTDLEIALSAAPACNIAGTVTDRETGAPLPASVAILDVNVPPVQTDPKNGRFAISVPAGDYKLKVVSFKYKTEIIAVTVGGSDVAVLVQMSPLPPALLVAHSKDNQKISKFYKDALAAAGVQFTYFDARVDGDVTSDLLIQYPLVVWFTGSDSSATVTETEQKSLSAYLNAGGSLLLTGQDIGYNLKSTKFYSDYLKAKYEADTSKYKDVTASSDFEAFKDFSFKLDGGDGANNQQYPDVVSPLAPAALAFSYNSASERQGAGVIYENQTYKALYLGFGFEGISSQASRNEFMKRAVKYLMPTSARIMESLASAESRISSFNNSADIVKVAELECEKIMTDIRAGGLKKLSAFVANFEKHPDVQIYKKIGETLRAAAIHSLPNPSEDVRKALDRISTILNESRE